MASKMKRRGDKRQRSGRNEMTNRRRGMKRTRQRKQREGDNEEEEKRVMKKEQITKRKKCQRK